MGCIFIFIYLAFENIRAADSGNQLQLFSIFMSLILFCEFGTSTENQHSDSFKVPECFPKISSRFFDFSSTVLFLVT